MNFKKILFLMADGFDTPTSINLLVENLLCDILDSGCEVHMVSGKKGGPLPNVPQSLLSRSGFTYDVVDRGHAVDKTNFIKRFVSDFSYVSQAEKFWSKQIEGCDCVLVQSTHLGYFHVSRLKKCCKKPVVYNLYDVFPDNTKTVIGSIPFLFFDFLQRRLYSICDRIVVISEDMKTTLVNKQVRDEKVAVVPIWHDDSVHGVDWADNGFASHYGVDSKKFIVQFAGSFGYVFDYKTLVRAAERLKEYREIEFHMVGQGARLPEFENAVREAGLSSVRFFPWQSSSDLAAVYSACSIGVIPLEKDVIFNAYPSKTSSLMACGKPSVFALEKDSCFAKMIEAEQIGFAVDQGDDAALAGAILRYFNDPLMLKGHSARCLAYTKENLERSKQTEKFIEVLDQAVVGR